MSVCSVTSDSWQPHGLIARQAPLSMGFSRQEYWSGLPFPPPGDLLTQGLNPRLLRLLHWQVDSLLLAPPGKSHGPEGLDLKSDSQSVQNYKVAVMKWGKNRVCERLWKDLRAEGAAGCVCVPRPRRPLTASTLTTAAVVAATAPDPQRPHAQRL